MLATAVPLVPLASGAWLLLYYFVLPRDRGDARPGNPPDIPGGLALWVGCAALGWSLPLLAAAVGVWRGRRSSALALSVLCSLQGSLQLWVLVRKGELWPWPILTVYTAVVVSCAVLALAAAVVLSLPGPAAGRGSDAAPPAAA